MSRFFLVLKLRIFKKKLSGFYKGYSLLFHTKIQLILFRFQFNFLYYISFIFKNIYTMFYKVSVKLQAVKKNSLLYVSCRSKKFLHS